MAKGKVVEGKEVVMVVEMVVEMVAVAREAEAMGVVTMVAGVRVEGERRRSNNRSVSRILWLSSCTGSSYPSCVESVARIRNLHSSQVIRGMDICDRRTLLGRWIALLRM